MLSHIYFLISNHKEVELTTLSQHFLLEVILMPSLPCMKLIFFKNPKFTAGQRMPAAVKLIYRDGVYAIDALSGEYDDPDKNVLTWLVCKVYRILVHWHSSSHRGHYWKTF